VSKDQEGKKWFETKPKGESKHQQFNVKSNGKLGSNRLRDRGYNSGGNRAERFERIKDWKSPRRFETTAKP